MKKLLLLCGIWVWIAAAAVCAAKADAMPMNAPTAALDPQLVEAVNAFLAAANTGDAEKTAACVHFESEEARAQFIRNLRQQMEPAVQSGRWQGACFQELTPLKDGSGGFWLQYGLCTKSEFGTTGTSGSSLTVQRVGGMWKVFGFYTYAQSGTFTTTMLNGRPDLLQCKVQEVNKKTPAAPWIAAMAQTRSLAGAQGLSQDVKVRNTQVMQAAAYIIRAVQDVLPDAARSKVFLFAFEDADGQLTLLGALPLTGKTPEDDPPAYRLNGGVTAGYRVTQWSAQGEDTLSMEVCYLYRDSEAIQIATIKEKNLTLPTDAYYSLCVFPVQKTGQTPKKLCHVFVLAHLPLTAQAVMLEKTAPVPAHAEEIKAPAKP